MIRRLAFVSALVFALAVAIPSAQNDVSGAWDLVINGPQGTINAGATMKQAGEKVTGTLSGPQGDVEMTGTISGKALKLTMQVNTPNGALDITMTGEVDGKEMKGILDFGMGQADFTGKKK
jgi:hypothetical protein